MDYTTDTVVAANATAVMTHDLNKVIVNISDDIDKYYTSETLPSEIVKNISVTCEDDEFIYNKNNLNVLYNEIKNVLFVEYSDGDYYGIKTYTVYFTDDIKGSLQNFNISLEEDSVEYDTSGTTAKINVSSDDVVLKEYRDYTVSYKDNEKVGTANVTVNGVGKYVGDISKTFSITKKTVSITAPKATYSIAYGVKAFNVNAAISDNRSITYTSSNTKVATVDSTGKVTVKV